MTVTPDDYRNDLNHYWSRLMWYRDELWRITTPVWTVYGAFISACIGYVWSKSSDKSIDSELALLITIGVISFSYVMQRLYWIYSRRLYEAISDLNNEVMKREQHIYYCILEVNYKSDYNKFQVYPKINMIFLIVGIAMTLSCIFTIAASVNFNINPSLLYTNYRVMYIFIICIFFISLFEIIISRYKKISKGNLK